jgi:PST family polysaccharide transporter
MNLVKTLKDHINTSVNLKTAIINIGWQSFDKVFRLGLGLFIGILVVRYLGPEKYGLLNYSISFINLFLAFVVLGLDNIVIRDIALDYHRRDLLLGTTFYLRLIGGILTFILSLFLIKLLNKDQLTYFLVISIGSSLLIRAFDVIDFWFQSQTKSKYSVIARNVSFTIIAALKITVILLKLGLIYFAFLFTLEFILTAISLVIAYKYYGLSIFKWTFDYRVAYSLLKESWPLVFAAFATSIYYNIDQIIIGEYYGAGEVGIYSAAVRFSEIWYFIPVIIYSSVLPTMTRLRFNNIVKFNRRLSQLSIIMFYLPLLFAIIMTYLSNILVETVYGIDFIAAGNILMVHIWSCIFVFFGIVLSIWTIVNGFQSIILISTISGAVLNILFDFLLIPKFHGLGAAIATIIAYSFSNYFIFIILNKSRSTAIMMARAIIKPLKHFYN